MAIVKDLVCHSIKLSEQVDQWVPIKQTTSDENIKQGCKCTARTDKFLGVTAQSGVATQNTPYAVGGIVKVKVSAAGCTAGLKAVLDATTFTQFTDAPSDIDGIDAELQCLGWFMETSAIEGQMVSVQAGIHTVYYDSTP